MESSPIIVFIKMDFSFTVMIVSPIIVMFI